MAIVGYYYYTELHKVIFMQVYYALWVYSLMSHYPSPFHSFLNNEISFSSSYSFLYVALGLGFRVCFDAILNFWHDFMLSISSFCHLSDKSLDRKNSGRISFASLFLLPHKFGQDIIVSRTCSGGEMCPLWPSRMQGSRQEALLNNTSPVSKVLVLVNYCLHLSSTAYVSRTTKNRSLVLWLAFY
jgi:hypothetical protein